MRRWVFCLSVVVYAAWASQAGAAGVRGAVNLFPDQLFQSGKISCGLIDGAWVPGTLLGGGAFLSHAQNVKNLKRQAKRASAAWKKQLHKRIRTANKRIKGQARLCAGGPPVVSGPSGTLSGVVLDILKAAPVGGIKVCAGNKCAISSAGLDGGSPVGRWIISDVPAGSLTLTVGTEDGSWLYQQVGIQLQANENKEVVLTTMPQGLPKGAIVIALGWTGAVDINGELSFGGRLQVGPASPAWGDWQAPACQDKGCLITSRGQPDGVKTFYVAPQSERLEFNIRASASEIFNAFILVTVYDRGSVILTQHFRFSGGPGQEHLLYGFWGSFDSKAKRYSLYPGRPAD